VALQSSRHSIKTYYANKDGSSPSISWNGNPVPDAETMQQTFEKMPSLWYEIQTIDCQVINPKTFPDLSNDRNFSMVVNVSGYMRVEDKELGPMHEFSETFLLVPNRDKMVQRGARQGMRSWLIQSQVFRYLVSHEDTVGMTAASMDLDEDVN
jgi:NTF2-related export protein 1/2